MIMVNPNNYMTTMYGSKKCKCINKVLILIKALEACRKYQVGDDLDRIIDPALEKCVE